MTKKSREMTETDLNTNRQPHYLVVLVYILLLVGLGFIFVGSLIGYVLALLTFDGSATDLATAVSNPINHPEIKHTLYLVQACATVVGLILTPVVILRRYGKNMSWLFQRDKPEGIPVLLTFLTVFSFIGVNSVFVEWNAGVNLPEFADGLERWMRSREDSAAELTKMITTFEAPWEMWLALLVIAVLPALGEEIVFRGMIQNVLYRGTANIHLAIWISAILFSAIHFQFFGFVPRLLLGALFGYLYYWSGSLWLAVAAHFFNNAISVVALYFYQTGVVEVDLETPEALPVPFVLGSALLTAGLLYYLFKYFERRNRTFPLL